MLLLLICGNVKGHLAYNIKDKKAIYRVQVSASKFSSFALHEKKDELILADESGELSLINIKITIGF